MISIENRNRILRVAKSSTSRRRWTHVVRHRHRTETPFPWRGPRPGARISLKGLAATPRSVVALIIALWLIAAITTVLETTPTVGIDVCNNDTSGMYTIQAGCLFFMVILPAAITAYINYLNFKMIKKIMRRNCDARFSEQFIDDQRQIFGNACVFTLCVVLWLPFIFTAIYSGDKDSYEMNMNTTFFIGNLKSLLSPFVYFISSNRYREGFMTIFAYICNRSPPEPVRNRRGERSASLPRSVIIEMNSAPTDPTEIVQETTFILPLPTATVVNERITENRAGRARNRPVQARPMYEPQPGTSAWPKEVKFDIPEDRPQPSVEIYSRYDPRNPNVFVTCTEDGEEYVEMLV